MLSPTGVPRCRMPEFGTENVIHKVAGLVLAYLFFWLYLRVWAEAAGFEVFDVLTCPRKGVGMATGDHFRGTMMMITDCDAQLLPMTGYGLFDGGGIEWIGWE